MTRVVRCPHCLSVVRAQVNERCRCPLCGGYFFVPNSGRAMLGPWPVIPRPCRVRDRARQDRPRRTLSSIPPGNRNSRGGVTRARGGMGCDAILQGSLASRALARPGTRAPGLASTRTGESRREIERGLPQGVPGRGTIGEPSLYPKDPEWEIIDGNPDYQLIVDFPYHRDREIAVGTEDGILAIRSLKEDAPPRYHIEFALPPEVVEESLRWVFNNGSLILRFDKNG